MTDWKETRVAVESFHQLLKCCVCGKLAIQPCFLGGCEHFGCKECVEDLVESCPICSIPLQHRDNKPNLQLTSAISVIRKMQRLLDTPDDEVEDPDLEEASATHEAPDWNHAVPLAYTERAKSPPVASRTRQDPVIQPTAPTVKPSSMSKRAKVAQKRREAIRKSRYTSTKLSTNSLKENKQLSVGKDMTPKPSSSKRTPLSAKRQRATSTRPKVLKETDVPEAEENKALTPAAPTRRNVRRTSRKSWSAGDVEDSAPTVSEDEPVETPSRSRRTPIRKDRNVKTPKSASNVKRRSIAKNKSSLASPNDVCQVKTPKPCRNTSMSRSPVQSPLTKRNGKGETPLHAAVVKGDIGLVTELLSKGATANVKDYAGWTPLHEACNHGNVIITKLLLDNGALVNVPGMDNDTPLHDAVQNNRLDCIELLLLSGASVNARNIHGHTPMDLIQNDAVRQIFETTHPETQIMAAANLTESQASSYGLNQIILLSTGLTREEKRKLQTCATLLHAKVVEEFCPGVTHVITGVNDTGHCPRTLKYLQALLLGIWILKFEWVEMVLDYKDHVNEEAFEVSGASSSPDSQAPIRARRNKEQQLPGLFDGCHFYLDGKFTYPTPTEVELSSLIRLGGGDVLTRKPKHDSLVNPTVPYHVSSDSHLANCGYFIVYDQKNKPAKLLSEHIAEVPATWVMDAIALFKIIDVQ